MGDGAEGRYLVGYLEAHLCVIRETLSPLLTGCSPAITASSQVARPWGSQMPPI